MHGFPDDSIPAKGEGNITDSSAYPGTRQSGFNDSGRLNEVDGIVIMLLYTGGDGKNIGIENNVFRWEIQFFCQNFIGPGTNVNFSAVVAAWPFSSKAMTITAAPYLLASRA